MQTVKFKAIESYFVHKTTYSEIFCCPLEHVEGGIDEIDRRLKVGVTSLEKIRERDKKAWKDYKEYEEIARRAEVLGSMVVPKRKITARVISRIRRWKFSVILWWKCHIY